MDTVAERWARLWPHALQFGPSTTRARPLAILFHGCGGVRRHHHAYAAAAVEAGWRVLLVDSYGPRGWSPRWAQYGVCTGVMFRGGRRAGDVLASVWGGARLPGVDFEKIALGGWSHGSWAIMDLMTLDLTKPGEAGLADPSPALLKGLSGVYAAYPYVGFASSSASRPWKRAPKVAAVAPRRDHLASIRAHMRAYASAVAAGAEVEVWAPDATHAFDEPGIKARLPIRYDEDLGAEAVRRFGNWLRRL